MPRKGMRSVFFHPTPPRSRSSTAPASPSRPTFSAILTEDDISNAEAVITKWDPAASDYAAVTSLFYDSRPEARRFLRAIADLRRAMQFIISDSPVSSSPLLVRSQIVMQSAMRRLEKEFSQILSANRDRLNAESVSSRSSISSYYSDDRRSSLSESEIEDDDEIRAAGVSLGEVENVPAAAMADLRTIAECMISSGYGRECVKIYKAIRRSIVDEGLYKLGFEKLTPSHLQKMDWVVLELRIKSWLRAARIVVPTLFSGERALCDYVFASSDSIRESCFAEIARDPAAQFLAFPELVAQTKRSPEKVFRILDLYEAFGEIWPEIESIFYHETTSAVHSQALSSLLKLGEVVRATVADFEAEIQKDASKKPVPGGGIHPLTRYVMNYMAFLADYTGVLADIFADYPLPPHTPLPKSFFDTPALSPATPSLLRSPTLSLSFSAGSAAGVLSERFAWLILVLLCKLDGKAKMHRDVALSYLYLANNLQYIVNKVRRSKLSQVLDDEWVATHEAKARAFVGKSQRVAWEKVLAAIPEEPEAVTEVATAKKSMRKFNEAFEEAHRRQAGWVVADGRMRDELKVSIATQIVRPYRAFYDQCRVILREPTETSAAVKFAPEDLGHYLSDLY